MKSSFSSIWLHRDLCKLLLGLDAPEQLVEPPYSTFLAPVGGMKPEITDRNGLSRHPSQLTHRKSTSVCIPSNDDIKFMALRFPSVVGERMQTPHGSCNDIIFQDVTFSWISTRAGAAADGL